ncbi:MAG TPA: hypothetical protein VHB25_20535, partial [Gemmatimonadaceae bacterium]|nr:hypothetical protein [Gemmatimonadaceae bacterium]
MLPRRSRLVLLTGVPLLALALACDRSSSSARRVSARSTEHGDITPIDPKDTAAYAEAGPEAIAAVARCHPPACRPDIFRGPQPGELTVGLDSGAGKASGEFQWHVVTESPPGGQTFQDSAWTAMLTRWEGERPRRLLLVDSIPRTFAYVREHVPFSSVSGMQELSASQARGLSTDPAAAHGAILITTKSHAVRSP